MSAAKEEISSEAGEMEATARRMESVADYEMPADPYGGGPPPLAGNVHGAAGGLYGPVMQGVAEIPGDVLDASGQLGQSGAAFFMGFAHAISESRLSDVQKDELLHKIELCYPLAPVVYLGVSVGLSENSLDTLIGLANLRESIGAAFDLAHALATPGGEELALELGRALGKSLRDDVASLIELPPQKFAYQLGKYLAPIICDIVLAIATDGAAAGTKLDDIASLTRKAENVLAEGLEDVRGGSRLAAEAADNVPGSGARRVDPDIDAMVESGIVEELETTTKPTSRPRPKPPASRGRAEAARSVFDSSLRDGYAKRLGVETGGQVHHAIELQALDRYPGVFRAEELNDFSNMRGIETELIGRRQFHNSKIREFWARHYRELDSELASRGLREGTKEYNDFCRKYLENGRQEIDEVFGQFFTEYRRSLPWERISE